MVLCQPPLDGNYLLLLPPPALLADAGLCHPGGRIRGEANEWDAELFITTIDALHGFNVSPCRLGFAVPNS